MTDPLGTRALTPPWGRCELPDDPPLALAIGPTDLWLATRDGEIRLAWSEPEPGRDRARTADAPAPGPPDDSTWTRWATPGGERAVEIVPALPDRTLVLEPETPFRLLPRAEARVFVRVPLWIRIEVPVADGSERLLLVEVPSLPMSDTWWGDFWTGELVYWLPTTARREMRRALHQHHLAACPLRLMNRSGESLAVEKLAFRVEHLSLFSDEGRLWADEARVSYQGEAEGSQIEMSGEAPAEAPGAVRVAAPRTPIQKGFRARTFDRLRQFPGVGGVL